MTEPSLPEESILLQALEIASAAERAAYLDLACGDNRHLRAEVEALLHAHTQSGDLLDLPEKPAVTVDEPSRERPGTVIGPYKLLQQIGEGGMGTVFMAEQTQPVQRKVALKVIKPGMDSRQVIARFEAERQALAMMDHVNIARVLDAGATAAGRPYFVMELVHGVPITRYCDDNRLTPRERLELFVPVCQALQHAHQKGVIHRDVKPSNVLVTLYDGQPVPKVIDFGVAKATEQKLTERTLFTQYGTLVGTLEYMSPEQAELSALGVDTRSDIYSLGVLLYELLTGSTPLTHKRMKEAAYAEILRMIKEEEPPRPSTRLSDSGAALASISAQRHMEPAKLTKLVRGELDWIVMKTLEKDRNRRYETANGLASDVQRYLADETVQACPPSTSYRLRKFARRNKRALAVAGLVLCFMVLLGGGAGWVLRDRSARLATTEREGETALAEATQLAGQRKWPEALAWVQRAEGILAHSTGSEALGRRVQDLRWDLEMVARLEEIRLQAEEVKDNHFDSARNDPAYAQAFREYGIDVTALDAEEAAERIRARTIPVELAAALDDWAMVSRIGNRDNERRHLIAVARLADPDPWRHRLRDAAQQGDRKALEELAASDQTDRMSAQTLYLLVQALPRAGAIEQQLTLLRKAQQRHPDDFWINTSLGVCLTDKIKPARPQEAVRFFTAAVALRPRSPGAHLNLGIALHKSSSYQEAVAAAREAVRLKPDYAVAHFQLGLSLHMSSSYQEAVAALREAVRLKPDLAGAHDQLGGSFLKLGEARLAADQFQAARTLYTQQLGPDHDRTLWSMHNAAISYDALGRYADALKLIEQTVALRKVKLGPDHPDTLDSVSVLAASYNRFGRYAEALKLHEETLALRKAKLSPDHPSTLGSMANVATGYWNLGRHADALKLREETLLLEKAKLGPDHPETLLSMTNLAASYHALDRHADAVKLSEETLALQRAKLGPDHPSTLNGKYNLAVAYSAVGRRADALKLHEETLALQRAKLGPDHPDTLKSMWGLADTLVKLDRGQEAVPIIDECLKRAAGKVVEPRLIEEVIALRLRPFEKAKNATGCRATAEMWENLKRSDANSLYNAACCRAVTAAVIRASNDSETAGKQSAAEIDRAMVWLRQAVAAGFNNVELMKKDTDLDAVRSREDFRKLLKELEAGKGKK
jgi:eukaryotic-like serine/threonine-protein kinase